MARIAKEDIGRALTRLGELGAQRGFEIELVVVGGAAMVLAFDARDATQDVDAVIVAPNDAGAVRDLASIVARELQWQGDWLNDGVKGYVGIPSIGPVLFQALGIVVRRTSLEQLLALKLCAWRDDVDIADARRILADISGAKEQVWRATEPFLVKGRELKAGYAFDDLWEERGHAD